MVYDCSIKVQCVLIIVCFFFSFYPLLTPLLMFLPFGGLPPYVPIVPTLTTLDLTFANIVGFNLLLLQFPQERLEFLLICSPWIVGFPPPNQSKLPSHTKGRIVVCS